MEGKHSYSVGGYHDHHFHGYEQLRRLQGENDYLRERLKSCERGMASLWQIVQAGDGASRMKPHQMYRGGGSPKSDSYSRGDNPTSRQQVTLPELKEAVQGLVGERNELLSQLEDMKRVTEAAKRERVLAIDEKDKLLSKYHLTKVALERKESLMGELEEEREKLIAKCRELEDSVAALKQVNEEARQTRLMALDERAKVIEERNQLQLELSELQSERDRLFEEKVQLKGSLQELFSERRQLQQEVESASNRCGRFETIARRLKEQNEVLCERDMERHVVTMERQSAMQPWGFSIEGGQGSEYFPKDSSIVVTGIAGGSPADGILRFGDRLLAVNGQDFHNISRKKAAEVLRSCDQLAITMEISRIMSKLKPRSIVVHIPGKKAFGFKYETRLYVSEVEEGSAAFDCLCPGDEIVQVLGKPALNMKLSHFKQVLKSCRGGISMTVHRMPGERKDNRSPTAPHRVPGRGREGERRSLSEYTSPSYQSYQAPGTPGSNLSETTGYYSTQSTSLPSVCSAAISPVTPDMKSGHSSFGNRDIVPSPSPHIKSAPSQTSTSQHSGYETDQTSFETRFRTSSGGSASNHTFTQRPPNDLLPYTVRPLYSGGSNGNASRTRMSSQSSYGGSSQLSSVLSPKSDAASSTRFPYVPRTTQSSFTPTAHSFSVDRLESHMPKRVSSDSHVTPALTPHSMSLSNVYRMGGGKRTNV